MRALLQRLFGSSPANSPWNADIGGSDQLVRAELFSIERLEQHATTLAATQRVTAKPPRRQSLQTRLRDNEAVLLAAYRAIAAAMSAGHAITPAAE